MNPTKTTAKDFFLNLGAIVALYTVAISLINLLFTVINRAYPQTTNNGYYYVSSSTISWPVATLIIFFPVFVLLMWLLEKGYVGEPEKRNLGVKRWLTYITLFVAGVAMAVDLVTVLYYFIDGQDLTAAFLLKVLVVLVVTGLIFFYYISEIRSKLNSSSRKIWVIVAAVVILASIVWGFYVLGSPRTQRLYKYDEQKINDLMNLNSSVQSYYSQKNTLPNSIQDLSALNYYYIQNDPQSGKPYEYQKTGNTSYKICAEFNEDSKQNNSPNIYMRPVGYTSWTHPAGHYCFDEVVNQNGILKPLPL